VGFLNIFVHSYIPARLQVGGLIIEEAEDIWHVSLHNSSSGMICHNKMTGDESDLTAPIHFFVCYSCR